MRKVLGRAAVAFTATALAFQASAFADGYGCSTCYGPPTPPPCASCPAPANCCSQAAVQHVHYHQKHGLFGHCHHAPMMMPMTAPVVQVPMAVQPQVAVAAAPAYAAAPAFATVATTPAYAVAASPSIATFSAASLASPSVLRFTAANFNVASQQPSGTAFTAASALSDAEISQIRALAADLRSAAADANASAASAQASAANMQSQIDLLKSDVADLKTKFECLRACLAQ